MSVVIIVFLWKFTECGMVVPSSGWNRTFCTGLVPCIDPALFFWKCNYFTGAISGSIRTLILVLKGKKEKNING
jgi:hypothetical protein